MKKKEEKKQIIPFKKNAKSVEPQLALSSNENQIQVNNSILSNQTQQKNQIQNANQSK
jgi:hypothetical protein